MPGARSEQRLREEFNRWADEGRGEDMEREHRPIVEPTLELMNLQPSDNVLDVGCGAGWLSRVIARHVPEGRVVGMDISDEMVRRARRANLELGNTVFVVGGVDEIPWEGSFFDKVISVESAYYWPDPAKGLREIFRVLREGGSAWVLINYYRDNPHCHQWGALLGVPTHLLSADEWAQLLRDAGFAEVGQRRIVDPTPAPEVYTGKWFRDAEQLRQFRAGGALLVRGTKPAFGITDKQQMNAVGGAQKSKIETRKSDSGKRFDWRDARKLYLGVNQRSRDKWASSTIVSNAAISCRPWITFSTGRARARSGR